MFIKEFRDAKEKLRQAMKEQGIETKGVKLGDIIHATDSRFPERDIWCDDPETEQTDIGQKTPDYMTEDKAAIIWR